MYVRDIMTTDVVTIQSKTSIADAKRIMMAHRIEHLPVVDKGKLKGIVTARRLEQVSPSKVTSLSVWELSYLLEKTTVKEIMAKNVITVVPDMTSEQSLAIAQSNKVGCLVVLEDNKVVGIVTANDFFFKIVNPMLGVGEEGALLTGTRIEIDGGGEGKELEKIIPLINSFGANIITIHVREPSGDPPLRSVIFHLDTEDASQLIAELKDKGYSVNLRKQV